MGLDQFVTISTSHGVTTATIGKQYRKNYPLSKIMISIGVEPDLCGSEEALTAMQLEKFLDIVKDMEKNKANWITHAYESWMNYEPGDMEDVYDEIVDLKWEIEDAEDPVVSYGMCF